MFEESHGKILCVCGRKPDKPGAFRSRDEGSVSLTDIGQQSPRSRRLITTISRTEIVRESEAADKSGDCFQRAAPARRI